jgi:adenosyl cobinamide kinase/adenosyl cobinamide phosphate guanylyltransferase
MPYTFLVGGARSGKSTLAVQLAQAFGGPVVVLATAEARDEEMTERIRAHRASRPDAWNTVEEPLGVVEAVQGAPPDAFLLLDCLTLWVGNLLEVGRTDQAVEDEARRLAEVLATRSAPAVVASNEVGLGIVPANALARRYRDLLGRVNARLADRAERAYLVVAGRVLALEAVTPT